MGNKQITMHGQSINKRYISILMTTFVLSGAILLSGCGKQESDANQEATVAPISENISIGSVDVTITATPGEVMLNKDVLLTLTAVAPLKTRVEFPPINDRLKGFIAQGSFDREPIIKDGKRTVERVIRLTPTISKKYRIAPMAIVCMDHSVNPPKKRWGATPPIVLPLHAITENSVGGKIKENYTPVWIYPAAQTVAGYFALFILLIVAAFLIYQLMRRVHRQVRLMRMSPRERALEELRELLNKKLIEKHKVKDFYVELTMVVRRYIERQHKVRAPEQTTEEFMAEISNNKRFSPEVIKRLRQFLQAADMVKFAAHKPNQENIQNSITTAKEYITTDAQEVSELENAPTSKDIRSK